MPSNFDLIITADYSNRTAELRLLDAHGAQLAYRLTDFKTIAVSRQQGLFDLRNYVHTYVEEGQETASVAEIGVCIAEKVLGEEIFRTLWESTSQRVLRIQLPGATVEENYLAEALARVPWEIARPSAGHTTLAERNLLVRVVHEMKEPASQTLELGPDECLRVLFVFAEARGSRPLAARMERRVLLDLFEREIYPKRRVVAHVLSHGTTRERLAAQIQENSGYHIVHWSGHGHLNLLELAKAGGGSDRLSGQELLDLFGGYIPRLVFLSACHSGDILRVRDWNDFLDVAQGKELMPNQASSPETKDILVDEQPGYTGTAHVLLQRGVPTVVAMRYAVGDDYARELGVEFYRALLAHEQPKTAAAALTLARQSLRDPRKHDSTRYEVCDHATPVLYGAENPRLTLQKGRSPGLDIRRPRLHRIAELTMAGHEHFVGRTWELAGLGAEFIGSRDGEVKPVALITGLGGMGKTALAAEALALWESRFEWVLLYQAKPNALGFDATLRDIHMKLNAELGRYHDHVRARPADAIYRSTDAELAGAERRERLSRNLVRALRDEPILLVLDNFETNLRPQAEPSSSIGEPVWACQDPAWDYCLAQLAAELVGTPSRVLITCRQPLAALAGTARHWVPLGPLPAGEAALYLREHEGLSRMLLSGQAGESALAIRLLNASRFHPLLMDRLARLATGEPTLRTQLKQALESLEKSHDYTQLPALFAVAPGDAKELAYLNDALTTSLDQMIRDVIPDARRLLWTIAVANDPVTLVLLERVWSGEDGPQQRQLRQVKQMLDTLPSLPPERQEALKAIPSELRTMIDALPPAAPARPDPQPLMRRLVALGLATEERQGSEDVNPDITCHELVRERIRVWMHDHPRDRAELTENTIRVAYAEWLAEFFRVLHHQNMAAALEAGSRAIVYFAQAEAYDRLSGLASSVVSTSGNAGRLADLIPHLRAAAESAPDGRPRWSCLCNLATALTNTDRADVSMSFFEQAAALARSACAAGGESGRQAWKDVSWITGCWAEASRRTGNLEASRDRRQESADAASRAGLPAIEVIGGELEVLRIDVEQGRAASALPDVEARLAQVKAWWQQHCSGQSVPEAPNSEVLARTLLVALDIVSQIYLAQNDDERAIRCVNLQLVIERELGRPTEVIATTRKDRAFLLIKLRKYREAKAELEACLQVFENNPCERLKVIGGLAVLFSIQGDAAEAIIQNRRALALSEQMPDPKLRAGSHVGLAASLELSGTTSALVESERHRLAALLYFWVAQMGHSLQGMVRVYATKFQRADAAGTPLAVPRLAELLSDPAFHTLANWLHERRVDHLAEFQAAVDQFLEMVRQAAL